MKTLLRLLATAAATPAMAHEIAADHSHVGESVLFHMSPLLAVGAGLAALAAFVLLRRNGDRKAGRDRRDPR